MFGSGKELDNSLDSSQEKRIANLLYELPEELPNDLRLTLHKK